MPPKGLPNPYVTTVVLPLGLFKMSCSSIHRHNMETGHFLVTHGLGRIHFLMAAGLKVSVLH